MINEAVAVALIGAVSTVIGVMITNRSMLEKQAVTLERDFAVYQAKTNERIDELVREVREHNEVIKRVYVAEEQIKELQRKAG